MNSSLPQQRTAQLCSTSGRRKAPVQPLRSRRSWHSQNVAQNGVRVTKAHSRNASTTTCSSATAASFAAESQVRAATLGLSTYAWPRRHAWAGPWLDACIKEVVKHLDQAPFLQLSCADGRHTQCRVPEVVASVPQLWRGIAEHLSACDPEVLVFVSRITVPAPDCALGPQTAALAASDVLTGISLGQRFPEPDWRSCTKLGEEGEEVLAGKVGDCCEEEGEGASHSHAQQSGRAGASLSGERAGRFDGSSGLAVEFWGVVVQSRSRRPVEGCYVLKTASDPAPDCRCTHYSLVKVCEGDASVQQQLTAAWLP